jgi:hypothetical protein
MEPAIATGEVIDALVHPRRLWTTDVDGAADTSVVDDPDRPRATSAAIAQVVDGVRATACSPDSTALDTQRHSEGS